LAVGTIHDEAMHQATREIREEGELSPFSLVSSGSHGKRISCVSDLQPVPFVLIV
jgi:hypothetical protein